MAARKFDPVAPLPALLVGRIVVVALSGLRDDVFAQARAASLIRALVEFAEVIILDLDSLSDANPVSALNACVIEHHARLVVMCCASSDAKLHWSAPAGTNVVLAPARVSAAPVGSAEAASNRFRASQIWVRSEREYGQAKQDNPRQVVSLVPDHFDMMLAPEREKEPAVTAVLASCNLEESAFNELCDQAIAVVSRGEEASLLAPARVYEALARRGYGAHTIRVDDAAEAAARAPNCLVHADDAELRHLAAIAGGSDCQIVLVSAASDAEPTGDCGPRAVSGQSTVTSAVGATLSAVRWGDRAAVGERLGRALGFALVPDFVDFFPNVRLLHAEFEVHGSFPSSALSGDLHAGDTGGSGLINAWVQVTRTPAQGRHRIRATAAVLRTADEGAVQLVLELWGLPVARIPLGLQLRRITAGLIAVSQEPENQISVEYWGDPGEVAVQVGTRVIKADPVHAVEGRPGTFKVCAAAPQTRNTVAVLANGASARIQKVASLSTYLRSFTPSSKRLADMKDIHAGRVGWLVGNGPSVRSADLDLLAGSEAIKFCFNRFHLAHDQTKLVADYTVTADRQMIVDFGEEILAKSGGVVFIADAKAPQLTGDYCWVRQVSAFPSLFSRDPARYVTPGGSSLYVAMQLGHYMGIRKWFVYGADFAFTFTREKRSADVWRSASGDDNHFIPGYRNGKAWCPPSIENILPSFLGARQLFESEGGFIRNATRGGYLQVFDNIPFEEAIANS